MDSWAPDLFSYTDYRAFLRDYYTAAKKALPQFSYRYLARRAGFSASNFFMLVAEGKRNLGPESIEQVAHALRMNEQEGAFFERLVTFAQASTPDEKRRAWDRIAGTRRFAAARPLHGMLLDYLSHWYYPAIRELAARSDFRFDPSWVAEQLRPPIKPKEAKQALEALGRLGVLVQNQQGQAERGEPTLNAGHEVHNLGIGSYHREMMKRAGESIEAVSSDERDLSAMTVCVSRAHIAELKRRLRELREGFMAFCDADADPEVVYQINIQLFPLSHAKGEREGE